MQLKSYNLVEKNIFMSFLKSFAFQVEDTEVVSSLTFMQIVNKV